MGGKSTPNYGDVAASDDAYNRESVMDQLFANRPDQYTPWGYNTWQQTPYTDPSTGTETMRWSQTTGLTPELQDLYNKQLAMQGGKADIAGNLIGRVGSEFGTPMDWRGLSPMGINPGVQFTIPENDVGDPNAYRGHAENAMYNRAASRLDPQFAGQRQQMEIKLRNQGLGPQDAAWQAAMQGQGRTETDAYNQATWGAVDAGRSEANQMFQQMMGRQQQNFGQALSANQQNYGQMMSQSNQAMNIRQQQMTEAMQKRGFSLNEINALMSGGQVGMPQMPNFSQAGVAPPSSGMTGAANQGSVDAANNPWASILSMVGQGFGGWAGGGFQTP